ncbi:MAG TPA: hypothetical protein VF868_06940 [Bacteroidia bacterium]|jgi:hypothetical protein
MKNLFLFILVLLYLNCPAQFSTYNFTRKIPKPATAGFYAIPVTPDVVSGSASGLSDLRLYDLAKDTAEIPYLTEFTGDKTEEKAISFELINDVTKLKCCSFLTLKMDRHRSINMISLEVAENNFDKIITLEGSNDNKEWFTIKEHLRIVGFENATTDFRSTTVSFPSSEYNYFRLRFDDDSSPRITVTNAFAFENSTIKGEYDEIRAGRISGAENKKNKTSETIIELPGNYILDHIKIGTEEKEDFYRNINIYRSAGTFKTPKGEIDSWVIINSGVITSDADNIFSLHNAQAKKLKIEVINNDNRPITLNNVRLFSEKIRLVTKLPVSDDIYLAYGKKDDPAPVYDLVHFRDKIPAELEILNPEKEEINIPVKAAAAASPFIKNKMWLWAIMGLVILLIGYFALSMIKKEKPEN